MRDLRLCRRRELNPARGNSCEPLSCIYSRGAMGLGYVTLREIANVADHTVV